MVKPLDQKEYLMKPHFPSEIKKFQFSMLDLVSRMNLCSASLISGPQLNGWVIKMIDKDRGTVLIHASVIWHS